MSKTIRITVLVENSVHRQGLLAEHGFPNICRPASVGTVFEFKRD